MTSCHTSKPTEIGVPFGTDAANENPAGEWNTNQIVCNGSAIGLFVNGKVMNQITGCTITSGYIGIQAEGVWHASSTHTIRGGLIYQADDLDSETSSAVLAVNSADGSQYRSMETRPFSHVRVWPAGSFEIP